MRMTLDISAVDSCAVASCAYNVDESCHARAITVGDGLHPGCDTFFRADRHVGHAGATAGVGACKVTNCQHNSDLECGAGTIRVTVHENHADCATYAPR